MRYFRKHKKLPFFILIFLILFYAYFMRKVEKNTLVDKDSIHYVNDIYMSNRLFYNTLDDDTKELYLKLMGNIKNYKSKYDINIETDNCGTLEKCSAMESSAMNAIIMDHPELLQVSTYYWSYDEQNDSKNVKLGISYAVKFSFVSKLGEMRIERIIDKIKKETKDMSDVEKVKYVYEWIGKNNKYDRTFMYSDSNQSAYTVFINHNSVCAGFAKASQMIFQNIGIESYYVTGTSTGPHAFNIIKINGKYYLYDSTVASCIDESNEQFYDGLKQSYLQSYRIDNASLYPKLEKEEFFINQ